jgi:hypothetical protein
MFIFAHVFAGALLGLGIWHLTNDHRTIGICIAGSILPDLIDKSLGLLFPAVLGSGRTVFHSLGIFFMILILTLMFTRSRLRVPGIGAAGAIILHQVFDEMWALPANWFYPLLGPFKGHMIPDYLGTYFWFEITNPSEWLFMLGTVMILVQANQYITRIPFPVLSDPMKTGAFTFAVTAFGCIGFYLVAAGLMSPEGTFITPLYNPVTNVMAGLLPLNAAVVIIWEKFETSPSAMS